MLPTAVHSPVSPPPPRILSEHLETPAEPLALLLGTETAAAPAAVAARAARALLDLPEIPAGAPPWLAPHQAPAARRLTAIIARYGGAVLADAVGLGKSYVALAVARMLGGPFTLVVPAVLVDQWRALLHRLDIGARIITHESLSRPTVRLSDSPTPLFLIDEAHHFRNPETLRYRSLARVVVGARILLVTATPIHNRPADLFHLFRLFLRDHALAGLGIPSLRRAAAGDVPEATLAAVAARLVVARSRERVRHYAAGPVSLAFPLRATGRVIRAGTAAPEVLGELAAGIRSLAGIGTAGPLFRLVLLRRLASSLPALRVTLRRYEGFLDLAARAAAEGRVLSPGDCRRWLAPDDAAAVQLALFPVLLAMGRSPTGTDLDAAAALLALAMDAPDPKADALVGLLATDPRKTIVFAEAVATVRHLLRRLSGTLRVAAVVGDAGFFGTERVRRSEVLAAFAPLAQGATPPPAALRTEVLLATDLVGEGLNLQDAARVVHYDLPWSPARLAQRVGRVDRLGSPHAAVEAVTFLPPEELAAALTIEERLARKLRAQVAAGAAQAESTTGPLPSGTFDWCDRLQQVAACVSPAPEGSVATVAGGPAAVVVIRLGALVDAVVVEDGQPRSDPVAATNCLEVAGDGANASPADGSARGLAAALRVAAPLLRERLAAVAAARWRMADRDRLSRRLIPWVLAEARRAARRRDAGLLESLDSLVTRLSTGMTAGEEVLLDDLLERRRPVAVRDLLAWHARLPPATAAVEGPAVQLVAALVRGHL